MVFNATFNNISVISWRFFHIVNSTCSTSGTRFVTHVIDLMMSWTRNAPDLTTNGIYQWLSVTQTFCNYNMMTSALPLRNPASVASFLTSSLYQGNPDMKHKLWNINWDIYSMCRYCYNVSPYKWEVHNGKIEINSLAVSFSISMCRCR